MNPDDTSGANVREPLFAGREMDQLPPRVLRAVESVRFALTLKAGDMDGISAVNIARDAGIITNELRRQIKGRKVRP